MWSRLSPGSVDISLDSLSPHSRLQPRGQAGPTLAQMQQQSTVQMNSLTMQMGQVMLYGKVRKPIRFIPSCPRSYLVGGSNKTQMFFLFQANLGGMQPMPMSGIMPQQQMGFGGGMPYGGPGVQPVTSPTSAAKASLQKKADQAFADFAVFKWMRKMSRERKDWRNSARHWLDIFFFHSLFEFFLYAFCCVYGFTRSFDIFVLTS